MKQEKSVKAHADVLTCISGDSSTSTNIVTGMIYYRYQYSFKKGLVKHLKLM